MVGVNAINAIDIRTFLTILVGDFLPFKSSGLTIALNKEYATKNSITTPIIVYTLPTNSDISVPFPKISIRHNNKII